MANELAEEIEKFDQHADDWWNVEGSLKTLHQINPLRLAFIQAATTLAGKKVLDVGCGGGILSEALAQQGGIVTGIDRASSTLAVAREHAQQSSLPIDYFSTPVEEYAKEHPGSFDVITCMEMLEHVPNPEGIVKHITQLLKPGGDLFLSTINRSPKAYLQAILGAEYLLRILPIGTHNYRQFIRPSELSAWCRRSGLSVRNSRGIGYNPLIKKFYLQDSISVNYLLYCKKV